jgi:steroid delta-isomerase
VQTHSAAIVRFREFYDTFSPAWLDRLEELYAPGFHLEDPFHTFDGDFVAMRAYFNKVLTKLADSKFFSEDDATGTDGTYVRWRWEWKLRGKDPLRIVPGVTHLRFDRDGKITHHRDHFDAADGFYAALPVVGTLLRQIKKRL